MSVESALRLIDREFKYRCAVAALWDKQPGHLAETEHRNAIETAKLLKRIERSLKRKDRKRGRRT